MRPRVPASLMIALFIGNAGCFYVGTSRAGRLYLSGRYSELEQQTEKKMSQQAAVEHEELAYLCAAYWKLKKYDKLFACGEQMERSLQQGEPNASWLLWDASHSHLWGTAFAYIELGDYAKAVEWATKSYEVGKQKHLDPFHEAYSLSALALAYAFSGDRIQALKYAALLEEVNPRSYKYRSLRTEVFIELAKVYLALRDFDKALLTMQRSESEGPSLGWKIKSDFFMGATLTGKSFYTYQELPQKFMLTKALFETGHLEEAKEKYDWLLRQPGTPLNGDIYWLILFDRGRIAEKEGDLKEAIDFYEKAVRVIETQRSTINTEASKIGFIGDKQTLYHHLINVLFSDKREGKAFEYVERSKSRALVDLLASKKEFAIQRGNEKEINEILKELDALEMQGRIQETDGSLGQFSQKRSLDIEIKDKLKSKAPELASLVTVAAVSPEEIQSKISPDETLVEYYYQGEDLYVFLITQNAVKGMKLNGGHLLEEIQEFRASLEDPASPRYLELAQSLHQRLIQPIESSLEHQNCIFVPHGALHYLPFNALKGEKDYLIDRFSIRFLPSASVMNYLKASERRTQEKVVAFGNPEYEGGKPTLTYAEKEVRAIAQEFPESDVLVGKNATETVFKKVGSHFNYIHLATHGIFEADSPLASGLLLTKDSENDGLLSAEELYSLHLNADLVTLSACETGLSKITSGDDLVGLTRGFLYAGSKAIVASLWSVDDAATSYLMTQFYSNLKKTNTRDALREAQIATKQKYQHPFYWAAFQLTGQA